MAALVRGANLSAWSLEPEAREAVATRLAANLLACAFHWGKALPGDPASRARGVEARAYATAQVASVTTTGARPRGEGTPLYAREAARLALLLLSEAPDAGGAEAGAGAGAGVAAVAAVVRAPEPPPLPRPLTCAPHRARTQLSLQSTDREFLTAERCAELLAPLTAPGAAQTEVKLSTKSFGREAAAVAAAALRSARPRLLSADLSDVVAGRPEAEALDALRTLCEALAGDVAGGSVGSDGANSMRVSDSPLESLDLSDNALGEKGVRAAGAALSLAGLRRVTLQNVGASAGACAALASLLPGPRGLTHVVLFNNMTGDEGATHVASLVARCPGLQLLRLASSRVGPPGAAALAAALAGLAGQALVSLDLSDNGMGGAAAGAALGAAASRHPRLARLVLSETGLGDDGAAALAAALAGHPGLAQLELSCCEIGPGGATALADLFLAPLCGATGGTSPPPPARLTVLRLAENELGDAGARAVCRALVRAAAAAPAAAAAAAAAGRPSSPPPAMAELDLSSCELTGAGARAAGSAAAARRCALLRLGGNAVPASALAAVRAALAGAVLPPGALAEMEDNDEDGDDDGGDDDGEEGGGGDAGLGDAMAKASIA